MIDFLLEVDEPPVENSIHWHADAKGETSPVKGETTVFHSEMLLFLPVKEPRFPLESGISRDFLVGNAPCASASHCSPTARGSAINIAPPLEISLCARLRAGAWQGR
jgi:hypothetical protein